MDFALICITAFRIVAGPASPDVLPLCGKPFQYLQAQYRTTPQRGFRVFTIEDRSLDLFVAYAHRIPQPDYISAEFIPAHKDFDLRFTAVGFPYAKNTLGIGSESGRCHQEQQNAEY